MILVTCSTYREIKMLSTGQILFNPPIAVAAFLVLYVVVYILLGSSLRRFIGCILWVLAFGWLAGMSISCLPPDELLPRAMIFIMAASLPWFVANILGTIRDTSHVEGDINPPSFFRTKSPSIYSSHNVGTFLCKPRVSYIVDTSPDTDTFITSEHPLTPEVIKDLILDSLDYFDINVVCNLDKIMECLRRERPHLVTVSGIFIHDDSYGYVMIKAPCGDSDEESDKETGEESDEETGEETDEETDEHRQDHRHIMSIMIDPPETAFKLTHRVIS